MAIRPGGADVNGCNPAVYIMQYETQNPQTGAPVNAGNWSNPFNTMNVPLFTGLGFAVWLDNDNNRPDLFLFPRSAIAYKG